MLLSNWGLKWPPRGADLAWEISITTSVRERIHLYSGLDFVTPYFRPLLLGWWVGALTTEGHDLFTLIKNIAKPMAIKIRYSIL